MLKKGVQNILFVKLKKEVTKSLFHDENVTSGSGVRVKASDAVFIEIPTSEYYYKNLFGEYKKIEKGNTSNLWSCTSQNNSRAYYLIYNIYASTEVDVIYSFTVIT